MAKFTPGGYGRPQVGATTVVTRVSVKGVYLHRLPSPSLKTNVYVPCIALQNTELYFFPERIILKRGNNFGAVMYENVSIGSKTVTFIEEHGVASDARVIRQTWKYLNKSGGPDRRFGNNAQVPVCEYSEYEIGSGGGMLEVITTSKKGAMDNFAEFIREIGKYQQRVMGSILYRAHYFFILALALNYGCGNRQDVVAGHVYQRQIDSLRRELEYNKLMTATMNEVGQLMDSIDYNRDVIRLNIEDHGGSFRDYATRMRDLNQYVKATSRKINALEKTLKTSNRASGEYLKMIQRFKQEISEKTLEIAALKGEVANFKIKTRELETLTVAQQSQISVRDEQLTVKDQQLSQQEYQMEEIGRQARRLEGEAYYRAGEALELAAQRTHLAPRKKKETLREALELFRKSSSLGNDGARIKIENIQRQIM